MARTNKYASLNFNDIYEKRSATATTSSSSLSPSTPNSNSRIHGHMLVLSRPQPKPISIPIQTQPKLQSPTATTSLSAPPDRSQPEPESDVISLRPQGRTGSGSIISSTSLGSPSNSISPLQSPVSKSDRFVPPHLRPGFKGRQEKPHSRPEVSGGPHRYGPDPHREDGRPKSGGGHDGRSKYPDFFIRPGSSG